MGMSSTNSTDALTEAPTSLPVYYGYRNLIDVDDSTPHRRLSTGGMQKGSMAWFLATCVVPPIAFPTPWPF